MRGRRALAAACLAAAPCPVLAQPFPPAPPDERRLVGPWAVEHVAEEDGGRLVRLTRKAPDYRLDYHVAFWRGNYGLILSASAARPGRVCGGEGWREPWGTAVTARAVRARLAAHLTECDSSAHEIAQALTGFERAFAVAAAWTRDAEAATRAEAEAIANYGREPPPEAAAGDPR
ncbi:MAG TPA: hypothetical protein VN231_04695 [Allosphingosinicella sp.]|nr:hypothetical protein [Allosphingosinicella sp.]